MSNGSQQSSAAAAAASTCNFIVHYSSYIVTYSSSRADKIYISVGTSTLKCTFVRNIDAAAGILVVQSVIIQHTLQLQLQLPLQLCNPTILRVLTTRSVSDSHIHRYL